MALIVLGVLQSSAWGWVTPKPGGPEILGLSPVIVMIIGGGFVLWLFALWEKRVTDHGGEPLVVPGTLKNNQLSGGLIMFFFQFLLQGGYFFIVPLFLSIDLGLNALETGARLVPLSLALIVAAAGIPKVWPKASSRRVVRIGVLMMLVGLLSLLGGIELDASPAVVAMPMVLMGLGIGALASQLGAVAVAALPNNRSGEVGGLQNTASNLGISLGTALAGSVLIALLTSSLIAGIQDNPDVPDDVKSQATTELSAGVPFLSDADLEAALQDAGVDDATTEAVVEDNQVARVDGLRAAVAVLAVLAVIALFFTGTIPTTAAGTPPAEGEAA